MFGVCDGHGQLGHEVSGYIKERLPIILRAMLDSDELGKVSENESRRDVEVALHTSYEDLLQRVFLRVD